MEIKTTIQYHCTLTQIDEWKRLEILCGLKGVDQMEILHTVNGAVKKNHFGKSFASIYCVKQTYTLWHSNLISG